ncbi:MAG: DUF11 domain-containing protein [Lentisphaerae bacterium]|nr:DUF11 domain-containing protein [Lentisphaerota bacterium]
MPSVKNTQRKIQPPGLRRHVALPLVLLLCTALGGVLHAQGLQPPLAGTVTGTLLPPAGTIIRNHAIIQFQRENDEVPGRIYDAPSNEVLIEILPVYNIEILPDGDAPGQGSGAPPGQLIRTVATSGTGTPTTRVVINYTLHFTGNASDNVHVIPAFAHGPSDFLPKLPDGDTGMLVFSDVDANGVYDSHDVQIASWRDSNSNGQIDAGEVQLTPLGRQFPPGTVFPLHLVFRVPPDTPAGANCFVGLEGTSVADSSAVDPKSPDSIQNIVQVQVVEDAVVHISKDANVTQAVPGNVIAYTVTAKNVGKAAAKPITVTIEGVTYQGVAIADILPTLSTGEPVPVTPTSIIAFPPDGVTGTFHFSNQTDFSKPENDPSWNWHSTYQTGDTVVAYITSDGTNHYGLGIGKEIIFKFDVPVPSGPEYTDQYPLINVAHCRYDTNGLGVQTVKSNEVPVNVQGPLGVLVRDTDFEAQRPPLTPANDSVVDRQTIQVAQAGTFVYFTNRILNKGAGYETFNICLDPDATINPNKWSVTFFKSDGVTPLRDSGIGLPLTSGLLAPAGANLVNPQAYMDIVMRVEIPEDAKPTESNPNPFEAKFVVCVSASSNIEVADTTENWIVAVKSAEMHLANFIPPDSEDENALTKFGDPGKYVEFPLVVQNLAPAGLNGGEVDVYTLSTPVLPTGWSVTYYRDLNKNGVLDANELLPVLRSGAVAPQEKDYLIARVGISPYARADVTEPYGVQDEYPLRFRATSSNLPDLYKEQDDIVKVNWQNRFELQPNRQGTIEPNGVTIYEHTVTNYGERANRFYLTLTTGHANWTYFLLQKDNGAELPQAVDPVDGVSKHYVDLGKAGETNDKATFLLRIYAPGGTPQGTMDLTSILVTANDPGETTPTRFPGTPLHIATDVTFVVAGDLVLIKSADPAPGAPVRPGDSIEYTTTFFNKSADPLAQLTIQDQISPHTAYVLTSANKGSDPLPANLTGVTFEVSRNGGISWTADAGSGTDTSVTNIRAVFTGSLGGGAEGKFIFTVKVR